MPDTPFFILMSIRRHDARGADGDRGAPGDAVMMRCFAVF